MTIYRNRVFVIKFVHSVLFLFMVLCLFYVLYCAVTGTYNMALAIALATIIIEGVVLMFYGWECPLTGMAERYGAEKGSVTDIFLPDWLAPYTFKIFGVLFAIGIIVLAVRYFI